jgi:tRNA G18 (ribose-2'-O)-methylase SpoU
MAEGARLVVHAQQRGHHLNALLVSTKYSGPLPEGNHGVLTLGPEDIQRLTGFGAMREMLGAFDRPADAEPGPVIAGARSVLVLEGVANPSNVGTIIRSAVALGMDATLVGPASSDPYGRRALRTSMGTALDHPWAPDPDPIATCRANGIATLALTPDAGARRLEEVLAERTGQRVALVLGAEGPGLTHTTLAAADERVTIPMAPGIDSLNVAAAAAIACYLVASR